MNWIIFQIALTVFNCIGFGIGTALMYKSKHRYELELKELNSGLDRVKELRESYEKDIKTHLIPTPEWTRGWMWN